MSNVSQSITGGPRGQEELSSICIRPDGSIKGLYTDDLPLAELFGGGMSCYRASSVEWDNARQEWVVRTPDGTEIASGPNREQCIQEEIRILGRRLT